MAFAPDVAITLSTQAPHTPAAVVATITEHPGDSNLAGMSVVFPTSFGFNERFRPARCQPKDEAAQTCPAASRIGTVSASSVVGPATGSVYVTQDFRLVAFASALGGTIKVAAGGTISVAKSGGFAVDFTGLPNLPLNSLTLSLENPLLKTPRRCRVYRLRTQARGFGGETHAAAIDAPVTGCAR